MSHIVGYLEVSEKCNRTDVLSRIMEEAEREGDGYPGWVKWHEEVSPLENRDAAERWISDHDKGWYDDHAVRFYSYYKAKQTKKMEEYQSKIKETRDKADKYVVEHSVRKQKAAYIGCGKCGSKIAEEYLRSEYCPVCRNDLRSKTTIDTLNGYEEKIKSLQQKIEEEKKKQKDARVTLWLVKYEYHC